MKRILSGWSMASVGEAVLLAVLIPGSWSSRWTQREQPAEPPEPERAIARILRELQMDLEGSSSTGVLRNIDSARFEDYARFRAMIEQLLREDTLRVFFRQIQLEVQEASARTILDAEMEITRRDSALPAQRRRQQVTLELERTDRGWKVVDIISRDFFRPL